jgi:adenylate kinase family enzyme
VESSPEEFVAAQQEIVNQCQWIVEGNYSRTFEIRAEHADTIIYLELPRYLCLLRVIRRFLVNMGKARRMGEGCPERWNKDFIKYVFTTYDSRRRKMMERLEAFQKSGAGKTVVILKSKQAMHRFLENIKRQEERNK